MVQKRKDQDWISQPRKMFDRANHSIIPKIELKKASPNQQKSPSKIFKTGKIILVGATLFCISLVLFAHLSNFLKWFYWSCLLIFIVGLLINTLIKNPK